MKKNSHLSAYSIIIIATFLWITRLGAAPVFQGDKTTWHGFDRYDFTMDEQTLAITSFKALPGEGDGIKDPEKGTRRCIVVLPKEAAAGNPWSWRGCYWNHQPQTEIELLKRGFCIAYISANEKLRPGKEWDAWYAFLTEHGLSRKPAFVGMSRGGEFEYTWATAHPDEVSCIYGDNPYVPPPILIKLGALATNNVPLFHVCGSIDPLLGDSSIAIENIYQQFGGRISMMIKEGRGHHPHSLRNPKIIADFIEQSVQETNSALPDFVGRRPVRTYYYSTAGSYQNFPDEGTYITLRGPAFTECYERYQFEISKVESFVTVIAPKNPAPGNPWVFRCGFVSRGAAVDQALLAKGFYIVTGAVPYNEDGPVTAQWNSIYEHFVAHGFSKKVVMEGAGSAAGEVYAWAIENPDKVFCIYAENPIMHSNLAKTQPLDNLAPLAKAGVPILQVCGSLDPSLADNTIVLEKKYKELGGEIHVTMKDGEGHYLLTPIDSKPVVDFILKNEIQPNSPLAK